MLKNNMKKTGKKRREVLKLNRAHTSKLRAKNLTFESLPRTIGNIIQ